MLHWLGRQKARLAHKPSSTERLKEENAKQEGGEELLFPSWPPPGPRELISRRDFHLSRLHRQRYRAPEGVFTDTPLYALYRLYEWLLLDHTVNLRNELEVLWWTRWPVSSIPDPGDQDDPERYAVLSCIPALVVESFNERNRIGLRREEPHSILSIEEQLAWAASPVKLETVPEWTRNVPPLKSVLHIPLGEAGTPPLIGMDEPDPAFKEKNILMPKPHIHFI